MQMASREADTKRANRVEMLHIRTPGVQLALAPSLRAQLFPADHFSPPPPAIVQISRDHWATLTHNIGLATASPYRFLALDLAHASLPPPPDLSEWNITQKGWTKYHHRLDSPSLSGPLPST